MESNIILGDISALKLAPGDILVIHHAARLKPVLRAKLEAELQQQIGGKNNWMILDGDFKLATVKPAPTDHA